MGTIKKPHGIYKYKLINQDGTIAKEGKIHNSLSRFAQDLQLATWGDLLIQNFTTNPLGKKRATGFGTSKIQSGIIYDECKDTNTSVLALLNLPSSETNDNPDKRRLNIYDDNNETFDYSKVLGLGTLNTEPNNGNTYLGELITESLNDYNVDNTRIVNTWYFDNNKANGRINRMAILNSTDIYRTGGVWECLSRSNELTQFIPPNYPAVTGENEILIKSSSKGEDYYKINLETNQKEGVQSIPNGLDTILSQENCGLLLSGNKLYVVNTNNRCIVYNINETTGEATQQAELYLYGPNGQDNTSIGIWEDDLYVYVGICSTINSTYYNSITNKIYKSNNSTQTVNTISLLGNLDNKYTSLCNILGKIDNQWLIHLGNNKVVTCTDKEDIFNTITGSFTKSNKLYLFKANNEIYLLTGIGDTNYVSRLYNNSLSANTYTDVTLTNKTLWISKLTSHQHWISFGVPEGGEINKSNTQRLYVSYYLTYEEEEPADE